MEARNQITRRIRFELGELSARNGHHEFEQLCFHLARARICSNILPATGPVSSGGDQGRDFESFRTYLHESSISNSSFIGLASRGPIAFACTLTKIKDLIRKTKLDIKIIMTAGEPVIDIHYFCSEDLPIAKRNKLKKWAKETYRVHIEIYDGQAISEHLSDQDTFWIAIQFLDVSAEEYPKPVTADDNKQYEESLKKWGNSCSLPSNFADFFEIKAAVRQATFADSDKKNLPFWISKLELLLKSTPFETLKRKTTYEICVASLRGLDSLIGYEEQLSQYFGDIKILKDPSDLEDVVVLWGYCVGAYQNNLIQLTAQDLASFKREIINKLEFELQNSGHPGRRCALLKILGISYTIIGPGREDLPDFNKAIKCWIKLSSIAEKAPLFPLDNFADFLTHLGDIHEFLLNRPDFNKLIQSIDRLLSKRCGDFKTAEKCRDRAILRFNKGNILRAIKEIHIAKINWFAEETLKGSVLAILFTSKCYQELGLIFAAKYYSLIAAHISGNSSSEEVKPYASKALIEAALCDYRLGAFSGFFDFIDLGLTTFNMFSRDTDPSDLESEINMTLFHVSTLRAVTKHIAPDLLEFIDKRIVIWKALKEYLDSLQLMAEDSWNENNLDELWARLQDQMSERPFNDFGKQRSLAFKALGIKWNINWDNNYELNSASEELIAVLQVILADLADKDLCLLPTTIVVDIRMGKDGDISLEPIPSNEQSSWILTLPLNKKEKYSIQNILGVASTLLFNTSTLPEKQFKNILESSFKEGLSSKVFFGQRYINLYCSFITRQMFDGSDRQSKSVPEATRPFHTSTHPQLKWNDSPGPGYSKKSSEKAIKDRYKWAIIPIQYTLKQLLEIPSFKETVRVLRKDGWRDWHILTSIFSAALNYKVNKEIGIDTCVEKYNQKFEELRTQPEEIDAELIPESVFSEKNLRQYLQLSMVSTIKLLRLEIHQRTPDFEAISIFLGKRFNYWTDDVEHSDFGF